LSPDAATVIGYSGGLFALIAVFFLLLWGRAGARVWYGLPFMCGALSALVLINPEALPGLWGGRLGALFSILAYGAGWQAARVINGRTALPALAVLPCLAWLALTVAFDIGMTGTLHAVSATIRVLIVATFNALSAREFWRQRDEQLPSAEILFRVFAGYAVMEVLRSPLTGVLPAPLGAAPAALWSVVLFNLLVVTQALLVSAFMIALLQERVAASHYRMAYLDPLTGIGNRRAFDLRMTELAQPGLQYDIAFLILDIDRFKSINDNHGHGFGDKVIIRAAETAVRTLRRQDGVFRIGGEEFACILTGVAARSAVLTGERLRSAFERDAASLNDVVVSATMSIGVAISQGQVPDLQALLADADAALYDAKRTGRNKVVHSGGSTDGALHDRPSGDGAVPIHYPSNS